MARRKPRTLVRGINRERSDKYQSQQSSIIWWLTFYRPTLLLVKRKSKRQQQWRRRRRKKLTCPSGRRQSRLCVAHNPWSRKWLGSVCCSRGNLEKEKVTGWNKRTRRWLKVNCIRSMYIYETPTSSADKIIIPALDPFNRSVLHHNALLSDNSCP